MSSTRRVFEAVEREVSDYHTSGLQQLLGLNSGHYVLKYVASQWAMKYTSPHKLKVSETPALTWGTGTYVSPIAHPLSTALYGRCGLVAEASDAVSWRVFDARKPSAQAAYVNWVRAQPIFSDLILTVHSTYTNHVLRNTFREVFKIDCILFRPDQSAEMHTDAQSDTWLLVTDWTEDGGIQHGFSSRLSKAKFTVLIDEEFDLIDNGLPTRAADRKLEAATLARSSNVGVAVHSARSNLPSLSRNIVQEYHNDGFVHVWIAP